MLVSGSVQWHCRTNEELLAKLSTGDLVALEARYHAPCLASLYKKAERLKGKMKKMGQVRDNRRVSRLPSCFRLLKSHAWSVLQFFQFSDLLNLLESIRSV